MPHAEERDKQKMKFSEKVKQARMVVNLSQSQLAQKIGVSKRAVAAYETENTRPRERTMYHLAKALGVSVKYLSDIKCENPTEDIEKDEAMLRTYELYGKSDAQRLDELLTQNKALFAGGSLSEEELDGYFQALTETYLQAKLQAKIKFGKKHAN